MGSLNNADVGEQTDRPAPDARATPFWAQYQRIKANYPDALLWTRLGDFYEMFEEDARTGARELHLTLTSREFGKDFRVPMSGVPYHAADSYLARLLRKGFHVAICEQLSEPGHGLVEREVVRVVTPGTVTEPGLLPHRSNNYLAAVLWRPDAAAVAYADVTTGDFHVAQFGGPEADAFLEAELRRLMPVECLTPTEQTEPFALPGFRTVRDPWHFHEDGARERLQRHFQTATLEAFGCADAPLATACAGALLAYIEQTNPTLVPLLTSLRRYHAEGFLQLDSQTRRTLNLTSGVRGGPEGSLLSVLDVSKSAMGARMLRRWIGQPLTECEAIHRRQQVVAALVEQSDLRADLRLLLDRVLDVERIVGRCRSGMASARDLWSLHASLDVARSVQCPDSATIPAALRGLLGEFDPCPTVAALIETALAEPGAGETIAPGFSDELDLLVDGIGADRAWIEGFEQQERSRTGVKSLKVGFNKVLGYYIEVTNPNRALVPVGYVRKQTVAGAERYVTHDLKETEARLLRAGEEIEAFERRIFADLLRRLSLDGDRLLKVGQRLAEVDVFCAFAEVAERNSWVKPEVDESLVLEIQSGRHPIVESVLPFGDFIPNDCRVAGLGEDGTLAPRLLLITGPNMAGKSTFLRQAALLALMAQIGSFVPATSARVGIVDRIFTRVGAHDDLVNGASTFLVEMRETSTICRQATTRSLVIVDEVGRGTSPDDGRAIAQAVAEHLHGNVGARTLFATHFHDLASLADDLDGFEPWTFDVVEEPGALSFPHRMRRGVATASHGLHVARLAGLPQSVLDRARCLVASSPAKRFEVAQVPLSLSVARTGPMPRRAGGRALLAPEASVECYALDERPDVRVLPKDGVGSTSAPRLREESNGGRAIEALIRIDVARTTPLQALNILADLQDIARSDDEA